MHDRRNRRLEYYWKNGSIRDGWTPPAPGDPDRSKQVAAMKHYWRELAPKRALYKKMKAGRDKLFWEWHTKRYLRSRKIRNRSERLSELNILEALMFKRIMANRLTLEEFMVFDEIIDRGRKKKSKVRQKE
jgi:hypothetical protein